MRPSEVMFILIIVKNRRRGGHRFPFLSFSGVVNQVSKAMLNCCSSRLTFVSWIGRSDNKGIKLLVLEVGLCWLICQLKCKSTFQ